MNAAIRTSSLPALIWRHKTKSLPVFACCIAATLLALVLLPRTYVSQAGVFVRLGRESVTLDPTATMGQVVSVHEPRDSEINSIVAMMHSPLVLDRLVAELGEDTILRGDQSGSAVESFRARLLGEESAVSIPPREAAVEILRDRINISPRRKSNIIELQAKAPSPQQAQEILAAFLQAYRTHHLETHRTSGSLSFFTEQADLAIAQLAAARQRLRDRKNDARVTDLAARRAQLQQEFEVIESGMLTAHTELALAKEKTAALAQIMKGLPATVVTETVDGHPNEAADLMRDKLYQLQIREKELASKFTEDHPVLRAIQKQVLDSQKIADREQIPRTQRTTALNPTFETLEPQLRSEEAIVAALEGQLVEYRSQHELALTKLRELNAAEVDIRQLEEEIALLEQSHRTYAENREQARIDQALQEGRISNLNIYQPPTLQARPVQPQKALVLALGLAVGLFASAGVALLCDRLGYRSSGGTDASPFGAPVLGTVPRLDAGHLALPTNGKRRPAVHQGE